MLAALAISLDFSNLFIGIIGMLNLVIVSLPKRKDCCVVVVVLLFYVNGKHLRSYRDG